MDIERRISKAKTSLVLEHPFVGTIALNLPVVFTDKIATAAVDGKRIMFNPEYVGELSDEELKFLVAHECFHPMMEHNYRRNGRDPKNWNVATDYVINQVLTDERIGRMPEGGLLNKELYDAGDGIADNIFRLLPENEQGGSGGSGGNPLDDCMDADGDPSEQAEQKAEWKVRVAQAAQAAKMMGNLSANMERFVGQLLSPKVNWAEVMQQFVVKCVDDTRTFARPNRRFISQGLYLPSRTGESLGELVFCVDCSGSISDDDVAQYAAEIRALHEDLRPTKLHVLYFDTSVCHHDEFEPDDMVEMHPKGGGGTRFSPVFDYIDSQDIDPVAVVFLTDLLCSDFGDEPDYPVLWVTTYSEDAPFGEVTKLN